MDFMKKFVVSFTISLFAGLLLIALGVVLVDPFYHYHAPFLVEGYMDNAVYQTPGAAKNFKYDSVIVGSSMTENFRESWFEEMGLTMQKLSYSGAEIGDYVRIYDTVFDSKNEIKLVVTDINGFQLLSPVDAIYNEYPEYLYDGIKACDIKYLFNNDVFWESAGRVVERVAYNNLHKDDSYTWEEEDLFSEERARYDYALFEESLFDSMEKGIYSKVPDEERLEMARDNINLLVDAVNKHPEVTFVFYLPAYSRLYWDEIVLEDDLDVMLKIYEQSMEALLQCDNVILFDFQDEIELVNDLSRYRDVCHHDPAANRFDFECIRDTLAECGEYRDMYRVTLDNIKEHVERVRENVIK